MIRRFNAKGSKNQNILGGGKRMFIKKGRRGLVFLFVGLMFIGLGFTGTVLAADKIELTFWMHSGFAFLTSAENDVSLFEKVEPNVKITIEKFPYQQLVDKITPAYIAGTPPDALEAPIFVVNFQMKTGQLNSVPAWVFTQKEFEEEFYPAAAGPIRLEKDGKSIYYGIPMECNVGWGPNVLIDRDAYNEAGIDEKTWGTWDKFIQDMQKLTERDSSGKIIRSGLEVVVAAWAHAWVATYDHLGQGKVPTFNEDNTVAWNNEFGRKVLQTVDDYVNKWEVASLELADIVCLGKKMAATQQQGPWITAMYNTDFPDLNWEYVRIPNMPGVKHPYYSTYGGWGWFVSEKSKYKEQAWKFLKFRADPKRAAQWSLTTMAIPARIEAAEDPRIANHPAFEKWIAVLPYQLPMADYGVGAEEIRKVFSDMIMGVWLKEVTVDEAISDATKKINAIRERYGEIKK